MPPELTEAEKAKGRRAQIILYVVMAIFALAPFLLLWFRRR
jgi:hypothetical protein